MRKNPAHHLLFSGLVNITQRKHAEDMLRKSESRFRTLFEDSPVAMWGEDFSEIKNRFEELLLLGVANFRMYFCQNPDEIPILAGKVKILEVNRQGMELVGARNVDELIFWTMLLASLSAPKDSRGSC